MSNLTTFISNLIISVSLSNSIASAHGILTNHSLRPSVGLSVRKVIVAKQLIGFGCHLGW